MTKSALWAALCGLLLYLVSPSLSIADSASSGSGIQFGNTMLSTAGRWDVKNTIQPALTTTQTLSYSSTNANSTFPIACTAACTITMPTAGTWTGSVCFYNSTSGTSATIPVITTASGSSIVGAPVVNANTNPDVTGGPVGLFPQGQLCLQAATSTTYLATYFIQGMWFIGAQSAASIDFAGIPAIWNRYKLSCFGVAPGTAGDVALLQIGINGALQNTGYNWNQIKLNATSATPSPVGIAASPSPTPFGDTTGIELTSPQPVPDVATATGSGTQIDLIISTAYQSGFGYEFAVSGQVRDYSTNSGEGLLEIGGSGPYSTAGALSEIKLSSVVPTTGATGATISGACFLAPAQGAGVM